MLSSIIYEVHLVPCGNSGTVEPRVHNKREDSIERAYALR